jgi:hypothetical protein
MRTADSVKWLECIMTQQEIIEEGRTLSNSLVAARELEDTLNSVKARVKSELAEHEKKINVCTQRITSGKMLKEVACYTVFDTDIEKVQTFRQDTFEMIEERRMTPKERQTELELNDSVSPAPDPEPDHSIPESPEEDEGPSAHGPEPGDKTVPEEETVPEG